MKISDVEKATGLTAKAIRLYEEKGLISVSRQDNSYRDYGEDVVDKLKFIRSLRDLGVSLSQLCLHFNGVITLEELLNNRKIEMEKENIFHQESYNKCVEFINRLKIANTEVEENTATINLANVLLGLDIGTTNISAVILDYEKKDILDTYVIANTSVIPGGNDFCEFDADWIMEKSERIVEYLTRIYPKTKGIGITGQMHGMIYLSEEGKAVSPFYNWQDGRGNRKFSEIKTFSEAVTDRTGYRCSSGYAFVTMFYNRIKNIEPRNAKSFCSIMDYVVMGLTRTSKPLIHPSNAASFGLYDVKNNCFDKRAVAKLGLSDYQLPQISSGTEIAGYYKDIPVAIAIGDNQASFFGSVRDEKTCVLVNFGTGSQISTITDKYTETDNELETRPYLFGKYLICGSALCGGKSYALLEKFFSEYTEKTAAKQNSQYEIMNSFAEKAYNEGKPLLVSTLFCGTRKEPSLRGSISGIDDVNFTPGNLILGVLYGMAGELKDYFDLMETSGIKKIVASGNAVKRNPVLKNILKDIWNAEVTLTSSNEEAAIGSALYAGVSASVIELQNAKDIINEKK